MMADDFLKAASDPRLISDLAPQAATLEGFLFPHLRAFAPSCRLRFNRA